MGRLLARWIDRWTIRLRAWFGMGRTRLSPPFVEPASATFAPAAAMRRRADVWPGPAAHVRLASSSGEPAAVRPPSSSGEPATVASSAMGGGLGLGGSEITDVRAYARALWRWKFLLLAFVVVLPVAAYFYESSRPKVYQSSALMEITGGQNRGVAALLSQTVYSSGPDTTDLMIDGSLVFTSAIADEAAKFLHPRPAYPDALTGSVSVKTAPATGFLTITARAGSPPRAANVANAFAQALIVNQTQALRKQVSAAITQLQSQANLTANKSSRTLLLQQLAKFQALRASQGGGVTLIQSATPSAIAVEPRVKRVVLLALVAALLLGLAAVAVAEASDRRIRVPEDAANMLSPRELPELPMMGAVPLSAFSDDSFEAQESFATLRASLTYFNVDRPVSSVLITSAGKAEGKTTVAVGLAQALARGGKEVILLDADLRRPTAARRLGLSADEGLGAVLAGELTLEEALIEAPSEDADRGRLRVLPAGPPPPNPSELLASARMRELLSELADHCEILLIDSSPLLAVSDSMPLLSLVSGVMVIARVNQTSRDAFSRLRAVIAAAGGTALGGVTTGAAAGGLYVESGYDSGYGYKVDHEGADRENGSGRGSGLRARNRGVRG
jgi:capsular exopolysaccharide synthesis family protein